MTTARSRIIHTRASARQVPDLLQVVFTAELLCPSGCLWLVSPWVSDIPVIDNRSNGFLSLEPSWARTQVGLSQVLGKLLELGTTVHIATRPDDHNDAFLDRMRRTRAREAPATAALRPGTPREGNPRRRFLPLGIHELHLQRHLAERGGDPL